MAIGYEASVQTRYVVASRFEKKKKKNVEKRMFSSIDISKVFKAIMRKKENCLGSIIFSNCMKINWRLRWL